MAWACAGLLPPTSYPQPACSPRDWPSPMANKAELGELTLGLDKEGRPRSQGQWSQCCALAVPHFSSCRQPLHRHGAYPGSCFLLPAQPLQFWPHSWLWGRWVSTISPLAAPGRAVLPALLGGRGPRDRSTGGAGAGCMPAVAGAGWGCFPLCLLGPGDGQRCGSRPASFRQPIAVQLRGEGEGQPPQGFPNPGEGHHATTAQPETAPGLVHPNTRLGGASRNPGVPAKTQHLALPSWPLVGAGTPHPTTVAAQEPQCCRTLRPQS